MIHNRSITIALAPPPPLQIAAQPICPGFKACVSVTRILAPLEPIGWPSETPPP